MIYTVVMVSYNRTTKLQESINRLLATTLDELVIVDNNSEQATRNILLNMSHFDARIRLIQLNKNMGASYGFKAGLSYLEDKYESFVTTFLDDDAYFDQHFLDALNNEVSRYGDKYSFITPKVVNRAGLRLTMNRPMTIIPNSLGKMYNYLKNRRKFGDKTEIVEAASFIGLTIVNEREFKKSLLVPVDYFIYYDDLTFTYRLSKIKSSSGIYLGNLCVTHDMESGIRKYDVFRLSHILRNSIKFSRETNDTYFVYSISLYVYHFLQCLKNFNLIIYIRALLRKR
ncbi:hypothetical protein BTJ39_22100 [Izhakiella australiensis]|uniref:Glycosyltransferase 2-like domain-containing protein n=1 Tax=Izhakiella australiensis TaxID=1926881 RepID=A0A1S8Y959_9GAMM|nr:glycosyltransferase [Izhakiella australiensis]OON35659.1 hypothetical protein BTJ39_22100 [Izhakiella australiensis]